ncbi:hypothetical protein [Marilutibacter chinensis]|uniref:Lipoprotein n=1 Tax=Marilutibacter chinensis TaxID=2912247 RepID=A0ABS9HW94_9GAMM|nr:hypothetical protein [Lysobacter chinensis]MCF7222791.1 hypothetical protein [Lysobacter chinensis]
MNAWSRLISGAVLAGLLSACDRGGEPDAADIATAYSNVGQRNFYASTGGKDMKDIAVAPPVPPEPGTEASVLRLSAYAGQMEFRYEANKVKCREAEGRDPGYVCLYDLTMMKADGEALSIVPNLRGHLYRDDEGWLGARFNGAWLVEELDDE